ncbi:unnamed protein product [Prunus armeniaca]
MKKHSKSRLEFVRQVYELHRLYHIQKILMKSSIGKSRPKGQKQESWNLNNETSFSQLNYHQHEAQQFNPQRKLDLEQPAAAAEEYIADTDGDDGVLEIIDESEIELTLGPTRYNNNNNNNNNITNRRKRGEAPLTSDSGPSFSSSSTGSSHVNRTSSSRTHQRKHGQVPDMTSGYRNGSKNSSNIDPVEEQLRQDERLKLPPWLFQVLSLNMT